MEEDEFEMGDLLLLAIKEFEGKARQNDGIVTTAVDIATLTANSGKDMYLAYAQINCSVASGTSQTATIALKINGVTVETFIWDDNQASTGAGITAGVYKFSIGYKVAATQIIKLECTSISGAEVAGAIQCFEETTGATPRPAALTQGTATIVGGIAGTLGFLAKKVFQGKTRQTEGVVTTTGDLATLTANSGKDMYLAKASVTVGRVDEAGNFSSFKVELKANGVVMETFFGTSQSDATGQSNWTENFVFSWIGKVAALQIIKLEVITNDSSDHNFEGMIEVFEETTGVDPTA